MQLIFAEKPITPTHTTNVQKDESLSLTLSAVKNLCIPPGDIFNLPFHGRYEKGVLGQSKQMNSAILRLQSELTVNQLAAFHFQAAVGSGQVLLDKLEHGAFQ
jgi:hypothetical protein